MEREINRIIKQLNNSGPVIVQSIRACKLLKIDINKKTDFEKNPSEIRIFSHCQPKMVVSFWGTERMFYHLQEVKLSNMKLLD